MTGCPVVSYPPARARSGPEGCCLPHSLASGRTPLARSVVQTAADPPLPTLAGQSLLLAPGRTQRAAVFLTRSQEEEHLSLARSSRQQLGRPLPTPQLVLEQIWAQIGLGVRDAQFGGPAVRGRQQPADPARYGVLGELGIVQLTEFLKAGLLVLDPQHTGSTQMIGYVVAKDLQSSLDPGARGHRCTCRPPQVGIVEVGEPVGGSLDLAAHPPFLPGQQRFVGAQPGEQRSDGVAVTEDHPVDVAHLPSLCTDPEPAGRADQGQRRLRTGTRDFQGHGTPWLGEGAVSQKRTAPCGDAVTKTPAHDLRWQPARRSTAGVDQPGLTGERLSILDHPDDVASAAADARAGDDDQVARMTE